MMRRDPVAFVAPALLLTSVLLAACGKPAEKAADAPSAVPAAKSGPCELSLFIWSEYIDPDIITSFEKKYDCKVTTSLYESNEDMMAKLQGGGTALYDIVVPSSYVVPVMIKLGLLAPLSHEALPNLANLDEKFANPAFDPGNRYTAAYQWGTVGLYLRPTKGQATEESWGLIFDKAKQPGTFLLMDSIREMIGSALRYQGHSVNTTDLAELTAARDLLLAAKKRSQGFEGGAGGKNKVLEKAVTAAVVYNGDAVRGTNDDAETVFFVPKEGGIIWVDSLAIPAQAPHREAAEKFIDYILDAQIGAQLSNFNQYATPNRAAKAYIKPEDLANSAIYPPAEMMGKLEFVLDLGESNKLYDEIWTQVKSK